MIDPSSTCIHPGKVHVAVLPRLDPQASIDPNVAHFVSELRRAGFSGDLCTDYATRLTAATDNSIYQVLPAAVLFPRVTAAGST